MRKLRSVDESRDAFSIQLGLPIASEAVHVTDTEPVPVAEWETRIFRFLDQPIPNPVLEHGEKTVADVLTAMVAGSAVKTYSQAWDDIDLPHGESSVVGTDRTTDPVQAATLNATAAIVQEIEEGHNTGGHVGAGIVAGALAMAEHTDASGETLVESCVRTYEVCTRLEEAIFTMKARINDAVPWLIRNPHSTWTTVGPAVAGVLCAGSDPQTVRETLRLAANRAVVSMHDPYEGGPPSRNLTAGASAGVGVMMAQMARAGVPGSASAMTAVYDPFEELLPKGFTQLFEDLGEEWAITKNYFKPYPSCRYTHAPLDAVRDLERDIEPEDIDCILVETYANAADMNHTRPETLTGAKFSIPYILARYFHSGEVELDHFSSDAIEDEDVQQLADKVEVRATDEFESVFPEYWGSRATMFPKDGGPVSAERAYPRGDYRDPIPDDEFDAKLASLLAYGLPVNSHDAAIEVIQSLSRRSAREIGDVLRPTS